MPVKIETGREIKPPVVYTRYKLTLAYDGSAYLGWQLQPHGRTIQGELEQALTRLAGVAVKAHGSGRTDQGVHAVGQVAHFDLPRRFAPGRLVKALNAILPPDIRALHARRVDASFHARRSAVSKEYRYYIWNHPVMSPCARQYRAHVAKPLDVRLMRRAAACLVGHRDFTAFAANAHRGEVCALRNLSKLSVGHKGSEIVICAASDGFLYKMVRSLAGFLIRVGEGALPPEETGAIMAARLRTARVPTAPPQGLFLWHVRYR